MVLALPAIRGVIERRILVNFRIDPERIDGVLPPEFRPQLVGDWAIGGICLIRLRDIRPTGWPAVIGVGSENAAHRIAVEWDGPDGTKTGVFVPRRDTNSRLNTVLGGRLFAGVHHRARFEVDEDERQLRVAMHTEDGGGSITVDATVADDIPASSVFASLDNVSAFFEAGAIGYSPDRYGGYEGLELQTHNWSVTPLAVQHVESSFFGDLQRFPDGTVEFDNALLMRDIDHEWHQRDSLCSCDDQVARA